MEFTPIQIAFEAHYRGNEKQGIPEQKGREQRRVKEPKNSGNM